MADKEPINDAQTDEADSTESRLSVASAEFRSAADDLVSAQRQAIADQKNTDRPARYTSQTFGRVEIADDAGAPLVKGYEGKAGEGQPIEDRVRLQVGEVNEVGDGVGDRSKIPGGLGYASEYLGKEDGRELAILLGDPFLNREGAKRLKELMIAFEDKADQRWQELTDKKAGSPLTKDEEAELGAIDSTHNGTVHDAERLAELSRKVFRDKKLTEDEDRDYKELNRRPAVQRHAQEILDKK